MIIAKRLISGDKKNTEVLVILLLAWRLRDGRRRAFFDAQLDDVVVQAFVHNLHKIAEIGVEQVQVAHQAGHGVAVLHAAQGQIAAKSFADLMQPRQFVSGGELCF
jgi:hypothetical protein